MPTKSARKRPTSEPKSSIKLEAGKFYRARDGGEWCCFKVDPTKPEHCQAWCISSSGHSRHRIEYFFLDGRYDGKGEREHTLIEEILPLHQQVEAHETSLKVLLKDGLNACLKRISEDPKLSKCVPVLFDAILVFKFEGTVNDVRTHLAYDFTTQRLEREAIDGSGGGARTER